LSPKGAALSSTQQKKLAPKPKFQRKHLLTYKISTILV
jgi:hypothetical protein